MTIQEILQLRDRNKHRFDAAMQPIEDEWQRRYKEIQQQYPAVNQEALVRARAEVDSAVKAAENAVRHGCISNLAGGEAAGPTNEGDSETELPTDLGN